MKKIKISGIEVIKGKNKIPVEYFIEHFKNQGKDVEVLLRAVFGRDSICIADKEETSFSMSLEACQRVLESENISMEEIDMIIFSGYIPEYAMPQVSLMLHEELNGKKECLCLDMNANCIGMISALELISGYFESSEGKKKALIVGCDDIRFLEDKDNALTYGVYGNVACAIIVEKSIDEISYIIDSKYNVTHGAEKGIEKNCVLYPEAGFSKVLDYHKMTPAKFKWKQFNADGLYADGRSCINNLLEENGLKMEDVSLFCLSQLSDKYVRIFRDSFGIPEEKCPYVVRECGYTGTTSPFLVLNEAIKTNMIKRGDIIVMWTIGMGSDDICLIFKY